MRFRRQKRELEKSFDEFLIDLFSERISSIVATWYRPTAVGPDGKIQYGVGGRLRIELYEQSGKQYKYEKTVPVQYYVGQDTTEMPEELQVIEFSLQNFASVKNIPITWHKESASK